MGLTFCVSFSLLFASMNRDVSRYDEGLVLFGAVRVLHGDVPYRDFYANYGPAQFYVLAGLFKVFGPSILVGRVWDLVIKAMSVALAYGILKPLGGRGIALIGSVFTLVWLAALGFHGYPIFPCLLLALLSVYFVLPTYLGSQSRRPLILAGACIGAMSLFRPDMGLMGALAHVAALILFHLRIRRDGALPVSWLVRSISAVVVGVLVISVPMWLIVLAAASGREVVRDLVLIQMRSYPRMRSLPFPSLPALAADLVNLRWNRVKDGAAFLPPLAGLAAFAVALGLVGRHSDRIRDKAGPESLRIGALLLVGGLCVLFYVKGLVRMSTSHVTLAIVPAFLVVCMVWQWTTGHRLVQALALGLFLAVGLVCVDPARIVGRTLLSNLRWMSRPGQVASECGSHPGTDRVGCFRLAPDQREAIRFVRERTDPDERIFVGLTRHDRIVFNDVLFYFASGRLSATKWHHFDPGLQTTLAIQSEMVSELEHARPRLIVLNSEWEDLREPNQSAESSGVTILDEYIRTHYVRAATFGGYQIYLLRRSDREGIDRDRLRDRPGVAGTSAIGGGLTSLSRRGWARRDRVPVADSGHMSSGRRSPLSAVYAETDGPLVPQRANTLADCRECPRLSSGQRSPIARES